MSSAQADSWNTKADVSASWLYNDNPTLRPDSSQFRRNETNFGRVQARGVIEYANPKLSFDLAPRISRTYFPDEENKDLETTDFFVESNTRYDMVRNDLSLFLDYRNVGLLTDEFGDGVDNSPGGGGSGNTLRVDDRVQRYRIIPEWRFDVTRRDSISFSLNFFGQDYKLEKTNRADNRNLQVEVSYDRALTDRWRAGITAAVRRFNSDRLAPIADIDIVLENNSESEGATLNLSYVFSERTNMGLSVGRTNTSTETDVFFQIAPGVPLVSRREADIVNTIYNFSVNHQGARNSFSLLLSRGIVPSSLGFENTQTSLNFSARRRLLEQLTGSLVINAFDQEAVNSAQRTNFQYRLLSASGTLAWRFTRSWVVSAVYTYRQNNNGFGNSNLRGESNQYGMTLTYRWD